MASEQVIVIPMKPQSWNVLVRKHYRVVQKFKDDWREATWAAIASTHVKRVSEYPVSLLIHASWKFKKRHDIDSLATKFCVDSLVEFGVLVDDDTTHVASVTFTGAIGQAKDELRITIVPRCGTITP